MKITKGETLKILGNARPNLGAARAYLHLSRPQRVVVASPRRPSDTLRVDGPVVAPVEVRLVAVLVPPGAMTPRRAGCGALQVVVGVVRAELHAEVVRHRVTCEPALLNVHPVSWIVSDGD